MMASHEMVRRVYLTLCALTVIPVVFLGYLIVPLAKSQKEVSEYNTAYEEQNRINKRLHNTLYTFRVSKGLEKSGSPYFEYDGYLLLDIQRQHGGTDDYAAISRDIQDRISLSSQNMYAISREKSKYVKERNESLLTIAYISAVTLFVHIFVPLIWYVTIWIKTGESQRDNFLLTYKASARAMTSYLLRRNTEEGNADQAR